MDVNLQTTMLQYHVAIENHRASLQDNINAIENRLVNLTLASVAASHALLKRAKIDASKYSAKIDSLINELEQLRKQLEELPGKVHDAKTSPMNLGNQE